jgi:hypothetical protein
MHITLDRHCGPYLTLNLDMGVLEKIEHLLQLFTSGYHANLAHLPSLKSGVYQVKIIESFMINLVAMCISNLTGFCSPYLTLNLEMWVLNKLNTIYSYLLAACNYMFKLRPKTSFFRIFFE